MHRARRRAHPDPDPQAADGAVEARHRRWWRPAQSAVTEGPGYARCLGIKSEDWDAPNRGSQGERVWRRGNSVFRGLDAADTPVPTLRRPVEGHGDLRGRPWHDSGRRDGGCPHAACRQVRVFIEVGAESLGPESGAVEEPWKSAKRPCPEPPCPAV
jgi:hypothetical protein